MPTAIATPDSEQPLTIKEFAAFVRVHERTVRGWISSGKLHAPKFGHQRRIPRSECDRVLREGIQ